MFNANRLFIFVFCRGMRNRSITRYNNQYYGPADRDAFAPPSSSWSWLITMITAFITRGNFIPALKRIQNSNPRNKKYIYSNTHRW